MALLDKITEKILQQIDGSGFQQKGAYNLRIMVLPCVMVTASILRSKKKEDKPGIDIYIDGNTRGEQVHIPVV